ncbi:MAG: nicotinate-nucleotide adenylyltransferase [Candidatus Ratteibacteria bacterium]
MDKPGNKTYRRIGMIGGTFDPIHIGHLIIAEKAREEFSLEKVLFITAGIPYHKKKTFAPASHRFEMVKTAIKDNKYFEVDDLEIKRPRSSYTFDTILVLKKRMPNADIFCITGEDIFNELKTWHRYKELVKNTVFLVAPRREKRVKTIPKIPHLKYYFIDSPFMDVASYSIRGCLKKDKSVKYLLSDSVIKYIRRYNLYGSNKDKDKNTRD